MKRNPINLKGTAMLLILVLLSQSCAVYKKPPVTLEQAVVAQTRTKILTDYGGDYRYDSLVLRNGTYYGIKKRSGKLIAAPVIPETVTKVLLKNKSASLVVNSAILATIGLSIWHLVETITVLGF